MRKLRRSLLVVVLAVSFWAGAAGPAAASGVLFQTSTLQALMNGVYDDDYSFGDLAKHGDLGLGTFAALDGEMVAVAGKFYQVRSDGAVYPVSPDLRTPFAEVVFFKADWTLDLSAPLDLKQLEEYLSGHLASPNFPYAFKVTGKFSYIKTRSVPRQEQPYPPLAAAAQNQKVFEFQGADGVIVGFYHPKYLNGVNLAGYHFHFLTTDRRAGGHLLDCRIKQVRIELARLDGFQLHLPGTGAFSRTDLSGDQRRAIDKVEK